MIEQIFWLSYQRIHWRIINYSFQWSKNLKEITILMVLLEANPICLKICEEYQECKDYSHSDQNSRLPEWLYLLLCQNLHIFSSYWMRPWKMTSSYWDFSTYWYSFWYESVIERKITEKDNYMICNGFKRTLYKQYISELLNDGFLIASNILIILFEISITFGHVKSFPFQWDQEIAGTRGRSWLLQPS